MVLTKHYCLHCKKEFDYVGECPHCGTHLVRISEVHKVERLWGLIIFLISTGLLVYEVLVQGWSTFAWVTALFVVTLGIGVVAHENLLYELLYKDLDMRDEKAEYYWIIWAIWIFVIVMFLSIVGHFIGGVLL